MKSPGPIYIGPGPEPRTNLKIQNPESKTPRSKSQDSISPKDRHYREKPDAEP